MKQALKKISLRICMIISMSISYTTYAIDWLWPIQTFIKKPFNTIMLMRRNREFIDAVHCNDVTRVRELLAIPGINPDAREKGELTPLMYALFFNHTDIIAELMAHGTQINIQDETDGYTALIIATFQNNTDIVSLLLRRGAHINVQDNHGFTALMHANSDEIRAMLIQHGADVNISNNQGYTALLYAACESNIITVNTLLALHNNINHQNIYGFTALMLAANRGHIKIVKTLIAANADLQVKNHEGHTALDIAQLTGNRCIAHLIQQALEQQDEDLMVKPAIDY